MAWPHPPCNGRIETGRWYDIKIESTNRIRCYLDGKLVHDVRRGMMDSMYAVASREENSGDLILKVVNAADAPQDVRISLAGLDGQGEVGHGHRARLGRPADENSLEEPQQGRAPGIAPGRCRRSFIHRFPGNSVSVVRLEGRVIWSNLQCGGLAPLFITASPERTPGVLKNATPG